MTHLGRIVRFLREYLLYEWVGGEGSSRAGFRGRAHCHRADWPRPANTPIIGRITLGQNHGVTSSHAFSFQAQSSSQVNSPRPMPSLAIKPEE